MTRNVRPNNFRTSVDASVFKHDILDKIQLKRLKSAYKASPESKVKPQVIKLF